MQRDQSNTSSHILQEIKDTFKGFVPIIRNGWMIKLSTHKEENILLTFCSIHTGQAFVRFYNNEDDAVEYINMIVSKNSSEILPLE